ncbi:bifunctional biotin--[acetyl-CoA-carboxylase] ligase/biotin operon repressor BirA [Arsenophonus nasoniae]|uniref:Bifunctional ligase/repressor BirA n=2 Tax=Arsenophonus nasoniae TaxID=638 RepID=A0A4P7L357_9GAMM|nr:bifunctional biotin--[acetyl-CoA-carboxylase] ligase/biotin operon repressor BirA [Arsenophonus nasoniae]QBY45520.1 Bifunctional ligase/repressor BirA [Arsenophonus nasoniae]WGM05649.1 bifunctional biotin--[acetyl-CoA-carboxylase] ligase/biotin operon repressor BirA [Arsenophonus nasoniae]WGM10661.1 bifunctional biotin--[acetyl-CoA-carboxylase] ligase/biotin operon repressor BirA [Arsenophonus nasoniae]WGM15366.1 bifunctional biotin--[acetyl-CoA-carboxylase] ligase/biotin operon repressor Bi
MKDVKTPLKLITILSDGSIHSGEQLGELLGMTRAGINKHIYTLREWGIEVNTITGKGYQLTRKMDLLDYERIYGLVRRGNIIVKPVINSTNQYLLERIEQLSSGDACVAEYQTAGRGRRGRYWASPFGCNLYLSLYWHLDQGPAAAMGLSLVAGIVIAETLNKLSGSNIKVKWPNDLYLNEKKLAGILIEMIGKTGDAAHIVIGIGLNIAMSCNYETNINQGWINLEQAGIQIERNVIAGQIILALRHELVEFEKYGLVPFIKRWLALDNFLHKKVKLHIGDHLEVGIVKGINEHGAILLEQNGEIVSYIGGEISLRPDN